MTSAVKSSLVSGRLLATTSRHPFSPVNKAGSLMENDEFAKMIPNINKFPEEKKRKQATEDDSKEIYDWKTSAAEGEEKKQMEREGINLFMGSRGERSLKFLSEENFIMTDNRGWDE